MANPSPPLRWVMSKLLARAADPNRIAARRTKLEARRRKAGAAHVVEYFHQVDDGYSHLAAQMLSPFVERYDVRLVCHLVGPPTGPNAPEPDFLLGLSRYDAARIGPHYGLSFPDDASAPDRELVDLATRILAGIVTDSGAFVDAAARVGDALWSGSMEALKDLAARHPPVPDAASVLASGERRRTQLGHYSGAVFHYAKEWYWGVDRLYHLEQRLIELGACHDGGEILSTPPAIETGPRRDDASMTLEVYPSVRSPVYGPVVRRGGGTCTHNRRPAGRSSGASHGDARCARDAHQGRLHLHGCGPGGEGTRSGGLGQLLRTRRRDRWNGAIPSTRGQSPRVGASNS